MTAEEMREQCAQVADNLERRWRATATEQQQIYERCWIGGGDNRRMAYTMNAAADGIAAVAKIIRDLPNDNGQGASE